MDEQRWEGYFIKRCIGKGAQGSAYLCNSKGTDENVVVKTIFIRDRSDSEVGKAMGEVSILSNLQHETIVQYKDYFIDDEGFLCMVLEYAAGGDLSHVISEHQRTATQIPDDVVIDSGRQLLSALTYLRTRRVMHRDIKPANILIANCNTLRLTDFGVSKILDYDATGANTFTGTPFYISPELCLGETYGFGADVWSLGVTLYELSALKVPFGGTNIISIVNSITDGVYEPLSNRSSQVVSLIERLLVADPTERCSAKEALSVFYPLEADNIQKAQQDITEVDSLREQSDFSEDSDDDNSSHCTSENSLRWLERVPDAYKDLEAKIREKAAALHKKRVLIYYKKQKHRRAQQSNQQPKQMSSEALNEPASSDEETLKVIKSPPGIVKARFLQTVTRRSVQEGRLIPAGHLSASDDEEEDRQETIEDIFNSTNAPAVSKSVRRLMDETLKAREELGITSETTEDTSEAEEEAEECEEEEEEENEEEESSAVADKQPTLNPDLLHVSLIHKSLGSKLVYNLPKDSELDQLMSVAAEWMEEAATSVEWVDSDGDHLKIITDEDMQHAVAAHWGGISQFLEIFVS